MRGSRRDYVSRQPLPLQQTASYHGIGSIDYLGKLLQNEEHISFVDSEVDYDMQ